MSFENELADFIGKPTDLRPFVCGGSPLECQVFIAGFNPATTMDADFWQFWQSGIGFAKAAWFDAYKEDRRLRPLKPGRKRRNPISNTRRVIEWIIAEALPVPCLETNIYSAPTDRAIDLMAKQRITAPFDFLLATIKPRIIVAHGADAVNHIQGMSLSATIIAVEHFSRGWSQESARALGQRVKAECG